MQSSNLSNSPPPAVPKPLQLCIVGAKLRDPTLQPNQTTVLQLGGCNFRPFSANFGNKIPHPPFLTEEHQGLQRRCARRATLERQLQNRIMTVRCTFRPDTWKAATKLHQAVLTIDPLALPHFIRIAHSPSHAKKKA